MTNGFPPAFEKRMSDRLGKEWDAFKQIHLTSSPISVRINPKKTSTAKHESSIPWTQYGYYLKERPLFTLDPSFHAGTYYVQEASSMFLEQALKQSVDLTKPLRLLDLCAAPGGKSTHLLSLISENSLLISNEVIRSRASILSENIQKWGYTNTLVTNSDPEAFGKLNGYFDVMVIDAPCSGEGLFRKDAEAMNEWSPENVELCSQRQRRIVSDVWPALKENGILIYCTCTYSEEENENNLSWLSKEQDVEFVELSLNPGWGIETIKTEKAIGYRFYPHHVNGEGFFISVIRKTNKQDSIRAKGKKVFQHAPKRLIAQIENWIINHNEFEIIQQDELLIQLPAAWYEEIEFLSRQLHVISKGTALAEVKHEKFVPEHAFALSTCLNKENFRQIELTLEQALAYLRKENLVVGEGEKGFALMTFEGNGLGWVNLLGNRLNNLYPSNWRIRMGH
jgi:16S rRNA C967 or C1407 C5-methylase (RsmB/RsmF family)/NOL1/NOP2/fmu family ribosome biogenesis protein